MPEVEVFRIAGVELGGFLASGDLWALCRTDRAEDALGWFADSGFWNRQALAARPLLHVL